MTTSRKRFWTLQCSAASGFQACFSHLPESTFLSMVATVPGVLILLDFGEDEVGIAEVSENSKYASTTLSY